MKDPTNIHDLLITIVIASAALGAFWILFKSNLGGSSGKGFAVAFDKSTLAHIQNVRQRCEDADELEVVRKSLALYDMLTTAVTEGSEIVIVNKDGTREKLDLFPIKEE